MRLLKWNPLKKSKGRKITMGAGLAMVLGGTLLAWGYRSWSRRKAKAGSMGGSKGGTEAQPQGVATAEPGRLAEKFHSLDAEGKSGSIPRDLERDPKNIEQSIHPT